MEQWDIYDENKQKTGRTMNRNDWHMKPDEFHLTVLGVLQRPDGKYLITRRNLDKLKSITCFQDLKSRVKRRIMKDSTI